MRAQLGEYEIEIQIIKKNNKNIYFRFKDDGIMYITCNRFISEKKIKELILENEKALLKMYKQFLKKQEVSQKFYYLGDIYTIIYDNTVEKITIENDFIFTKDTKMLDKWLKSETLRIFTERINAILNNFTNIPKFSLKIRKMTSCWGVNNVTKCIITLNSELIKKDVTLIDYVIIHELCHFYEANHSKSFWQEVEKRYPYYKLARKRLRVE